MGLVGGILGQSKRVQFILQNQTIIQLDCSMREVHQRESPASKFSLENGQTISDNMIIEPHTLELDAIISDTPLSVTNALAATVVSASTTPLGVVNSTLATLGGAALFKALSTASSPSAQAYLQLLKVQESKMGFAVLTTLKRYENMYITGLTVPRDSGSGRSLNFSVRLTELLLVSPQTVDIKKFKNPDSSANKADKGQQQATPPPTTFEKTVGKYDEILGRLAGGTTP